MKIKSLLLTLLLACFSTNASAQEGLITILSQHSVSETADRFEQLINDKGLKFFARIDHSENAVNNDLTLKPTQLIIFGNPLAGTPLMNCEPTIAIDLPQKVLFWQDDEGNAWVSYNDPYYLQKRHLLEGCEPVLNKISGLLSKLATLAATEDKAQ